METEQWYLSKILQGGVMEEAKYNLVRYQNEAIITSSGGDFRPSIVPRREYVHVENKIHAICLFQQNILENLRKWPKGTYFEIEETP